MATRLLCLWKMTSKSCPYRCLSLFSSSFSSSSSSSASASPSFSCVWSLGCEKQWRTHTPTSHQVNKDKHSRTRHYNVSLRRLERHKSERLKIQARAFGLGNSSHQGASITRAFNSKQAQALRMEWTPNKQDPTVSGRTKTASRGLSTPSSASKKDAGNATAAPPPRHFCDACGTRTVREIPEGDSRLRQVCPSCHKIHYVNPKVVVGCLVECLAPAKAGTKDEGKMKRHVLLCKRGIEPCKGLWTLPAGFQECEESTAEGAARETREEANAEVNIVAPYAHLDIPAISQSYIIYRAILPSPHGHSPGEESLETELFDLDSIPFDQIAFSSMKVVLQRYLEDVEKGTWGFHLGTIVKQPGVSADNSHFTLSNYMNLNTDQSSKM